MKQTARSTRGCTRSSAMVASRARSSALLSRNPPLSSSRFRSVRRYRIMVSVFTKLTFQGERVCSDQEIADAGFGDRVSQFGTSLDGVQTQQTPTMHQHAGSRVKCGLNVEPPQFRVDRVQGLHIRSVLFQERVKDDDFDTVRRHGCGLPVRYSSSQGTVAPCTGAERREGTVEFLDSKLEVDPLGVAGLIRDIKDGCDGFGVVVYSQCPLRGFKWRSGRNVNFPMDAIFGHSFNLL